MSDNEMREAIGTFIHILRRSRGENSLSWIIRQVANGFVDGANNLDDSAIYALLIDHHDPKRVLEELLTAIERVIVETALMEEHIRHFFSGVMRRSFFDYFGTEDDRNVVFDLAGMGSDERLATSRQLQSKIGQIQDALQNDLEETTVNELTYALCDDITQAWDASNLNLKTVNGLYHLYVFTLVLEAAASEGAEITYWDRTGQLELPPQILVGPHSFHAENYIYAQAYFSSRRYIEVHINARITGKSKIEYECDIAVVRRKSARAARGRKRSPIYRNLLFEIECRFRAESIQLSAAQALLGVIDDVTTSPRGRNLYVVNSSIGDAGTQFLNRHNVRYHHRLIPGNASSLVEDIKEIFGQYKQGEA
jgi:hypothetical protein